MLEVIGAITGILSLLLSVFLDWDRIKTRFAGLVISRKAKLVAPAKESHNNDNLERKDFDAAKKQDASSSEKTIPSRFKSVVMLIVSPILAAYVAGSIIGIINPAAVVAAGCLAIIGFIAGFPISHFYLRYRSWSFFFACIGVALLLVSILGFRLSTIAPS